MGDGANLGDQREMDTESAKQIDAEVIEKIKDGEKNLYEVIIRRFNPYLYKVGRSYNYHHEDVLDLMQETFVDAYKNLSQFAGRSSFKTWIVRIMLNNCYRRKEKINSRHEIMKEVEDYTSAVFSDSQDNSQSNAEKAAQNRELGEVIEQALSKIPFEYRMVFSLREINGMSTAETASLLEITEANVKVRLNRAKVMLQDEIQKVYSPEEIYEFNLIYCDAVVASVMKTLNE